MKSEFTTAKKAFWNRVWYPREEDVVGFRVFQMISNPVGMGFALALAIFIKSRIWTFLMFAWLFISILLWVVASVRFKIINPATKRKG